MTRDADWLLVLEEFGAGYELMLMRPLWLRWGNPTDHAWHSFGLFLEGYAFERAGRSPAYAPAAAAAIRDVSKRRAPGNERKMINAIWTAFSAALGSRGMNRKLCPLYPSWDPDGIGLSPKPSLLEAWDDTRPPSTALVRFACNEAPTGIGGLHAALATIRGVGPKIASFFLRDCVAFHGLEPRHDRALLQPVDTWVRRIGTMLAGSEMPDDELARWIVVNSQMRGVSPERVNMGMWYFGSQIARSVAHLEALLSQPDSTRTHLLEFANVLRSAGMRLGGVMQEDTNSA